MYARYVVVGCCFVVAAILIVSSSNSYSSSDQCRNWHARSITSLFVPCVTKAEVSEPVNIGTPSTEQQDKLGAR
jgi:hypothetical protein